MRKALSAILSVFLIAAFLVTGQKYVFKLDLPSLKKETTTKAATLKETTTVKPTEKSTTQVATTVEETTLETTVTETQPETQSSAQTEAVTENESPESETKKDILSLFNFERRFKNAPEGYFNDALFIGDSRTEGLKQYGNVDGASFFCAVGLSLYNIHSETANVKNVGNTGFKNLLKTKHYGKIYVMLGINEIGYARQQTVNKYGELIDEIKKAQPTAVIFIQANIHVTKGQCAKSDTINNVQLNDFNRKISAFADKRRVFYIDPNTCFDDINGNLRNECTGDGIHLNAKYTREWGDWLKTKAV